MQVQLNTYADYLLKAGSNLIPSDIFNKIPELDSQILVSDPICYVKIVDIFTDDILYICEVAKMEEEIEFFGYQYNPCDNEFRELYFSLSHLVSQIDTILPYNRDESFKPTKLSVLKGSINE